MSTPTTTHKKNCEHCHKDFEAKKSNAKFCTNKCRANASRAQRKAQPVQSLSSPPLTMNKIDNIKAPTMLEPSAQWIIDNQKERIGELKDEIKEKLAELKKVQDEKIALEKELQETKSQVDAKPTGLHGFVKDNQSIVEKALEQFGPVLNGLAERYLNPQKQLGAGEQDHEVWKWLVAQAADVQIEFVNLIRNLNTKPDKIKESLSKINTVLTNVPMNGHTNNGSHNGNGGKSVTMGMGR